MHRIESLTELLNALREAATLSLNSAHHGVNPSLHDRLISGVSFLSGFLSAEGVDSKYTVHADIEITRRPRLETHEFAPIFLIGNRRSGTTLVNYIINASDNICATPELFLASEILLSDRLMSAGHRISNRLKEPEYAHLNRLANFINNTYMAHCSGFGKSRWASKEIFIPDRLDLLDNLFDFQAKYIYVVRHGFDVAYSCARRFPRRDGPPPLGRSALALETYLDEWVNSNELTMDFYERNMQRCHIVKYEDLIRHPESVSKKIFEFLGETWHDGTLDKIRHQPLISGMGDNNIMALGTGPVVTESSWQSWPEPLQRILARRANKTLLRLEYEKVQEYIDSP